MDIRARQKNDVVILDLAGRIDADSANLVEVVGQCVRDGYLDVLCNMEEVEFIDYMGVSAIVLAYKELTNAKGRMRFVNIPTHLRGVFSVAGLDRMMEVFASEDLAINSFKEDKIIEDIKKMQLRRRFKRLPIDIKAEVFPKSGKGSCLKVDILNLSAIGAFVFGCSELRLGDDVVVKLRLPPKGEEMALEAKVVWLPDKQVQPHHHPGVGVEFTHLAGPEQQKIIDFIDRNISHMTTDQP